MSILPVIALVLIGGGLAVLIVAIAVGTTRQPRRRGYAGAGGAASGLDADPYDRGDRHSVTDSSGCSSDSGANCSGSSCSSSSCSSSSCGGGGCGGGGD